MHFPNTFEICNFVHGWSETNNAITFVNTKIGIVVESDSVSDPILRFEHDDRVSSDDDHPDLLRLSGLGELGRVVENDVHERIEAAQDPFNSPTSVDLQVDLKTRNISQFYNFI